MENNHGSEFDRIIDGALSSYSIAEPLAGLEQRVLNRIRLAESRRKRFRFWQFAVAVAAALLVMIAVTFRTDRRPVPNVVAVVRLPKPPVEAKPSLAPRKIARRAPRVRSLPKEGQFPTLSPLTAEERALLAWVKFPAAEAPKAFADGPIEIQPIEIKPLQSDGSQ
jgi:hypothetical protein